MFHIIKKCGVLTVFLPTLLSYYSIKHSSLFLAVICFIFHFLVLKAVPEFKKRESLWMFIAVTFSSIPINVYTVKICADFFADSYKFMAIIRVSIIYVILFSIQQLVMGILTRIIWKRQYRLWLPVENNE